MGTRHQTVLKPRTETQKCVACGDAHSHKTVLIKKKENQSAQIVEDLMSPTTEAVLHTRTIIIYLIIIIYHALLYITNGNLKTTT